MLIIILICIIIYINMIEIDYDIVHNIDIYIQGRHTNFKLPM